LRGLGCRSRSISTLERFRIRGRKRCRSSQSLPRLGSAFRRHILGPRPMSARLAVCLRFTGNPLQPCVVQRPSPHSSRSRATGYGPSWTRVSDAAKPVVPAQRFKLVDSGDPSPPRASGCGCAHGLDVRSRAGFAAGPEPCCSGPGRSAVQLPARRTSESSGSAVAGPPGRRSPTVCDSDCPGRPATSMDVAAPCRYARMLEQREAASLALRPSPSPIGVIAPAGPAEGALLDPADPAIRLRRGERIEIN
jgi:hypothetical protein